MLITETILATLCIRGLIWKSGAHEKVGREGCNLKERRGSRLSPKGDSQPGLLN